jgi:hypothetical protein
MVKRVAQFQNESTPVTSRSAGILPWCVTSSGEVMILLGRESCSMSRRWAPFEGSAHPDEDIYSAAAREFVEESLGMISPRVAAAQRPTQPYLHADRLHRMLQRQEGFSHSVELRYRVRQRAATWKQATTLVSRVEYEKDIETRFAMVRSQLIELSRFGCTLRKLKEQVEGETGVYGRRVLARGGVYKVVDIVQIESVVPCDDSNTHVRMVVIVCARRQDDPGSVRYLRLQATLPFKVGLLTVIYSVHLRLLRQLLTTTDVRDIIAHPAVQLVRNPLGDIESLQVNSDFLEKDKIKFWSRQQLEEMLESFGHYQGNIFRSSSCALLQLAVENWDEWFDASAAAP